MRYAHQNDKIMSKWDCEQEKLTEEDLTYLKIAIVLFHVNLEMKEDMPKACRNAAIYGYLYVQS
jgi:hypothetical protein